eukprot:571647-Pelagomonas_calceolata.AAC.3
MQLPNGDHPCIDAAKKCAPAMPGDKQRAPASWAAALSQPTSDMPVLLGCWMRLFGDMSSYCIPQQALHPLLTSSILPAKNSATPSSDCVTRQLERPAASTHACSKEHGCHNETQRHTSKYPGKQQGACLSVMTWSWSCTDLAWHE